MQHGKKGLWPRGSRSYRITVQSWHLARSGSHLNCVQSPEKNNKILDSEPCSKQMTAWSTPSTRARGASMGWPGERSAFTQPFIQWEVQATGPRLLDFTIVVLQWSDYLIFNQSVILKMTTVTLILDRRRCTTPIFNLVLIFKRWIKREEGREWSLETLDA